MTSAGSSPALPRPPLPPSRRVAVVVNEETQPPAWADPLMETVLHTLKTGAKDRLKRRRSDERNHASQNHRIRCDAKAMAQKALSPNPNPQWTEYEMRSIDEWIAGQGVKLDRPEAIRRLVELGLKGKGK